MDMDEILYVAQPVSLLKVMQNILCASNFQGRGLCWHDFIKYMIDIVLCLDICELICFRLGVMLDDHTLQLDSSLNDCYGDGKGRTYEVLKF